MGTTTDQTFLIICIVAVVVIAAVMFFRRKAASEGEGVSGTSNSQLETDIAVIAAAVYTMLGSGRIVRIEPQSGSTSMWAASGRSIHQTSHTVRR